MMSKLRWRGVDVGWPGHLFVGSNSTYLDWVYTVIIKLPRCLRRIGIWWYIRMRWLYE
jgi:hypothetical protein